MERVPGLAVQPSCCDHNVRRGRRGRGGTCNTHLSTPAGNLCPHVITFNFEYCDPLPSSLFPPSSQYSSPFFYSASLHSLSLGQTQVSLKPFRIVEPRVRQLANTVVPRSLVALQQHQENIARHLAEKDWDRVNAEQINAARTAQVHMYTTVYRVIVDLEYNFVCM